MEMEFEVSDDYPRGANILASFIDRVRAKRNAKILELGTKRSNPENSTVHREWIADDATMILSDFADGLDVDIVADIHRLTDVFKEKEFDFIFCCSVLEHVQRPWIATGELLKVLKPGGEIFIQTHQSFPLHGFPSDYFRFSMEGLETLFADAGFENLEPGYDFPCKVFSDEAPTDQGIAFLNSVIVARRPQTQ